jgi:hypothetical protein
MQPNLQHLVLTFFFSRLKCTGSSQPGLQTLVISFGVRFTAAIGNTVSAPEHVDEGKVGLSDKEVADIDSILVLLLG